MFNEETQKWEGYIYKIYNDVNNQIYIGQTVRTVEDRWCSHRSAARNKSMRHNIVNAIRVIGEEHFHCVQIEKIAEVTSDLLIKKLDMRERYYISLYNSISPNGYNIQSGGHKSSGRPVKLYSFTGELLRIFGALKDASDILGISIQSIIDCCKGRTFRTTFGVFRYLNDPFDKYDISRDSKPLNTTLRKNIVLYFENGEKAMLFKSIRECSDALNMDRKTISQYLANHYIKDGKVLFYENMFDADQIKYSFKPYSSKVKRINKITGEIKIYKNRTEACKDNCINMNQMNNRINGRSVVYDDYTYQFC